MKLFNTLSRKIETVTPLQPPKLNIFVCGPTVYDYSHLGHAKTYIQIDTLVRALRASGFEVFYLQNITDIDDKIINRANERNIGWQELSMNYEIAYKEDMKKLGNTSVTKYAKATDFIDDIIRQVNTLLETKHAYMIEGDGIYFEISTFKEYGKLSRRQEVQENDAESRVDQSDQKRGWNDFCLWKFSKPNEPVWETPFGNGRPGWHIEDTAISEHFFGPQYDIHGGAIDLIFPHHEAEITQMESSSGKIPFVAHWVHTGFLTIKDAKMSKSTGNFYTIREVLEKSIDPMAIRLFMLQSHYRSSIDFSWDNLKMAAARLKNFQAMADLRFQINSPDTYEEPNYTKYQEIILSSLQDDLNTPRALAAISSAESASMETTPSDKINAGFFSFLEAIRDLLGINLLQSNDIDHEQKKLIKQREVARISKDWSKADAIRDELIKQGIGLRDSKETALWYRI